MLAQRGVETSDEWIVERTGIRARHFVADGVFASDLAAEACRQAMAAAGVEPADIDLIIVATSTPDMVFPSTAASCSTSWAWPVARCLTCRRCAAVSFTR
jgi:3-oxoacyl-[acyl-carrier-protein] synthase III